MYLQASPLLIIYCLTRSKMGNYNSPTSIEKQLFQPTSQPASQPSSLPTSREWISKRKNRCCLDVAKPIGNSSKAPSPTSPTRPRRGKVSRKIVIIMSFLLLPWGTPIINGENKHEGIIAFPSTPRKIGGMECCLLMWWDDCPSCCAWKIWGYTNNSI